MSQMKTLLENTIAALADETGHDEGLLHVALFCTKSRVDLKSFATDIRGIKASGQNLEGYLKEKLCIDTLIEHLADVTGYDEEFLKLTYMECMSDADAGIMDNPLEQFIGITLEQDW